MRSATSSSVASLPWSPEIVKKNLGYKYHWAVSDYLQRSARHVASAMDVAHATAVGEAAVKLALAGESGVMPVIERTSDNPYRWKISTAPLDKICESRKKDAEEIHFARRVRDHARLQDLPGAIDPG